MNYLAHLLLAGPDAAAPGYADRLVGQFIADGVPGRQLENYSPGVQAGIRAHRALDAFTDQHPVLRRSTARLRQAGHGKYAGVVADVLYDHFLARNFAELAGQDLAAFTARTYALLGARQAEMPPRVGHMFDYMRRDNWLLHYAQIEGIRRALTGLSRRAAPGSGMETAAAELVAHYAAYEADFREFWPAAVAASEAALAEKPNEYPEAPLRPR